MVSCRDLVWIILFVAISCAGEGITSSAKYRKHVDEVKEVKKEDVSYLEEDRKLLIHKVFEKSWLIGLSYAPSTCRDEADEIDKIGEAVKRSVLTWIAPLKDIVDTKSGSIG